MPNSQLFYTQVMTSKETTWGTLVTPTFSYPAENPDFNPSDLHHVLDQGFRGQPSRDFDILPGPGEGKVGWGGMFYVDSTPNLLMGLLGSDVVTTGASVDSHLFQASAAPPTYTVQWAQNVSSMFIGGCRFQQLELSFNGRDGTLKYTVSGQGKLGVATGSPAAGTYTQEALSAVMGWQGFMTVGGSNPAPLLEGTIRLTRDLEMIHAIGNGAGAATQDLVNLYPGPLACEARLTFDYNGTTEYGYYAPTPLKNAVVLKFIQTTAAAEFWITITKAGWRTAKPTARGNIYTNVVDLNGIHNTTDAGVCTAKVINAHTVAPTGY